MKKAKIKAYAEFKKGTVDQRLYGSFLEHMGRVIYSGIYEPGHPLADEQGFRMDVIKAVKDLGITSVRYPGGNFVSCYEWEDGVGPKDTRPRRLELAWKAIESNQFGTNEYMEWLKKVNASPMLAVNLGTRGLKEAVNYLEYCNFPEGTKYSNLRILHGIKQPYGVKIWCLGNEMDGEWQVGHKTAAEYGRLALETAKAMKIADPDIELVSCGSSLNTMDTFPEWEAETLNYTYDYVDYISLHQYFAGQEKPVIEFLGQADEMDQYIKTVISVCDFVKAKKRSDKTLNISFDEWGVWAHDSNETVKECNAVKWQEAPAISEMIYTHQDALLFGGMLLALIKNADRVKMACQSLLTNVSATIMTEKGGGLWLQPNYYPFSQAARYAKGDVLNTVLECEYYEKGQKKIPYIDAVILENHAENEIILFAINRHPKETIELSANLYGFNIDKIIESSVMESDDRLATNQFDHNNIVPHDIDNCGITTDGILVELKPLSWNMVRIHLQ